MKTTDIAIKYCLDQEEFDIFLAENDLERNERFLSTIVPDDKVEEYVALFQQKSEEKEIVVKKQEKEHKEKLKAMSQMLISSGFNFEGYKIVKYSGYISGDDATQIPRGTGGWFTGENHGENLTNALVKIRRQAIKELKEAAYDLGCNAIIGVDFDYITLDPQTANYHGGTTYEPYVICVTANGNAVVIEKDDGKKC